MKPIIILPPDTMSEEHIKALVENGLCVVVSTNPEAVKFLDPIPSMAGRTAVEDAAIQLSRKVLNRGYWSSDDTRGTLARTYVELLVKGTKLDPEPSKEEVERQVYDLARHDELRRIAREDARAERAAKKQEKAAAKGGAK